MKYASNVKSTLSAKIKVPSTITVYKTGEL